MSIYASLLEFKSLFHILNVHKHNHFIFLWTDKFNIPELELNNLKIIIY